MERRIRVTVLATELNTRNLAFGPQYLCHVSQESVVKHQLGKIAREKSIATNQTWIYVESYSAIPAGELWITEVRNKHGKLSNYRYDPCQFKYVGSDGSAAEIDLYSNQIDLHLLQSHADPYCYKCDDGQWCWTCTMDMSALASTQVQLARQGFTPIAV
jgi:hypothetical protein